MIINEKDNLPLQAGNQPLSNNPAGTADIEKAHEGENVTHKPDIITPETEKPDVNEVPERHEPEIENTDINELPDTKIKEVPDTDTEEIPRH